MHSLLWDAVEGAMSYTIPHLSGGYSVFMGSMGLSEAPRLSVQWDNRYAYTIHIRT